jgi:hypothetical protein
MMTRKDYVLISEAIAQAVTDARLHDSHISVEAVKCSLGMLANGLAYDLARDNPRFDKDRFLTACKFRD